MLTFSLVPKLKWGATTVLAASAVILCLCLSVSTDAALISSSSSPTIKQLSFLTSSQRISRRKLDRHGRSNIVVLPSLAEPQRVASPNTAVSTTTTASHRKGTTSSSSCVASLKSQIANAIGPTKRGLVTTPKQREQIESLLVQLESQCPLMEPARDARMEGKWIVLYTTAPPPSNGQLGPFVGIAKQEINLQLGTYKNILQVTYPWNANQVWLSATLDATWEEWDGIFLKEKDADDSVVVAAEDTSENMQKDELSSSSSSPQQPSIEASMPSVSSDPTSNMWNAVISFIQQQQQQPWWGTSNNKENAKGTAVTDQPDYGATCWKVTFQSLTLQLFFAGVMIPILTKQFDKNTSRIWRMTYLDDDATRIVRAGRTGKQEDEMVFYMMREG